MSNNVAYKNEHPFTCGTVNCTAITCSSITNSGVASNTYLSLSPVEIPDNEEGTTVIFHDDDDNLLKTKVDSDTEQIFALSTANGTDVSPIFTSTQQGEVILSEGAAPTNVANFARIYMNSTGDSLECKVNNDTAQKFALSTSTGTAVSPIFTSVQAASAILSATSDQLELGTTNTYMLNFAAPAASREITVDDPLTDTKIQWTKRNVVTLPADDNTAIAALQSGTIFILPRATANNVISLPAPAAGLKYKFILSDTANGTNTHTIAATSTILFGNIVGPADPAITNFTASTNLIVSATAANTKVGDCASFISDGINWYVKAITAGTANAFTVS